MMNRLGIIVLLIAGTAWGQTIHNGFIWIEGPDEVLESNTTYTLEIWGRIESPAFITGDSAIAGFGIDIRNTAGRNQIDSISNIQIADWAAGFGTDGIIQIIDLLNTSGGQLANLWGILNPNIDMRNPIPLFTFDFTTASGPVTNLEFTPADPNANGGLSFYPDNEDGASIVTPNDADSSLTLTPWTYQVPGPVSAAPLFLLAMSRRRCR
jgi:hypothetical protein